MVAEHGGTMANFEQAHNEELAKGIQKQGVQRLVTEALEKGVIAEVPVAEAEPAEKPKTVGLAFSGGGIRSATINLGILQALAKYKLLGKFDYLSTVSGGGFIGSWLIRWIQQENLKDVEQQLGDVTHEAPAVNFLRDYSNYLTPRKGLLGADTWAAAATYLRNVLLNQTVLVLALGAVLLVPWLVGAGFLRISAGNDYFWFLLLTAAIFVLVAVAFSSVHTGYCGDGKKEEPKFTAQWMVLLTVVAPLMVGACLGLVVLWQGSQSPKIALVESWPLGEVVVIGAALYAAAHLVGVIAGAIWSPTRLSAAHATVIVVCAGIAGVGGGLLLQGTRVLVDYWKYSCGSGEWLAVTFGPPVLLLLFLLTGVLHIGLVRLAIGPEKHEWWARAGGWMMLGALGWMALFALVFYAPLGVSLALGYAITKGAAILAWLTHTLAGVKAANSAKTSGNPSSNWKMELLAKTAPFGFALGLVVLLSSGIHWLVVSCLGAANEPEYWRALRGIGACPLLVMALLVAGAAVLLSWRVDINLFSMNLLYRNRLVRCYLGASRPAGQRHPNRFTGFDCNDDVPLSKFSKYKLDDEGKPTEEKTGYDGPFPILCATLNLTHGERLGWQERKAESFVFTPLYCGYEFPEQNKAENKSPDAFDPTSKYGFSSGVTLGRAVSISGAAVSPNMGYHTSPAVAFLLTFFNVRLGEWLPNTRFRSGIDWRPEGAPPFSLGYLFYELFGLTSDRSRYVYLTDGAHFENLALYELVRRKCTYIIASDAGEDAGFGFGDLMNAIRKCRTDLGAEITLPLEKLKPSNNSAFSAAHAVQGTIRYADGSEGELLYFKSALTGKEPNDVLDFRNHNPAFPNQSTADQWFDETQFESYRALGFFAADALLQKTEKATPSIAELFGTASVLTNS